jgi:hypothetical protein
MCTKLQIRCQNPQCRRPFTAIRRHTEEGDTIAFVCNECWLLRHGPYEIPTHIMPQFCSKCQTYYGWDECKCRIEFLYGGPIVICTTCHKQTVWLSSVSGTGFAGGRIYLDTFSCGHNIMDESDDMRAAI